MKQVAGPSLEELIGQGTKPFVILVIGVNGVGKTTTIAKLAQRLNQGERRPLLVAGDTFRAAAIDQLQVWADRVGVEVIRQRHGADPAAVAFDGIVAAKARSVDVVLIDTGGLHTKSNLMDELRKMKRVIGQEMPGAPHEVLLSIGITTVGQNALTQARQFHEAIGVTGLVLTRRNWMGQRAAESWWQSPKISYCMYVGVASVDDLQDFNPEAFVSSLDGNPTP